MNRSVPKEAVAAGILCEFLSFFPLSSSPRFSLTATTTVGLAHIRAGYPTLEAANIYTFQPYYYAVIPVLVTSLAADKFRLRGPFIVFNALCIVTGFLMFGLPHSTQVTVRYIGTFLATGAYVSNWAALNAYQANNVVGQWKRAVTSAMVSAFNGLGGVAGSYIVRQVEAPLFQTAVWVSVG